VPCALFLEYQDDKIRIRASIRTDNTRCQKFLNTFLNFIFLGKCVMIREKICMKTAKDKGNGMIMGITRRGNSLDFQKYIGVWRGETRCQDE